VADGRDSREWLQPSSYAEERPHRPVALRPDDPEWQYVSIRRLAAYIEQSLDHGLQWVVFEPNDEQLWVRVREQVEDFLTTLWREGRLVGTKAEDAFFVRCDRTTMTQDDIDNGRLVVLIGIAPLKPAEFVIFRIGQWAVGSGDADPDDPEDD
jgi:phage tail sheath protein FI